MIAGGGGGAISHGNGNALEEVQRVLLTEIMDNQVWPEVAVAIRVVQLEKE